MPAIDLTVPHLLTQDEALDRIKNLLQKIKIQYPDTISNLSEEWNANSGAFSFSAMGLPITGTLTVQPAGVAITGELPFAALPFKGMIEETIRERAVKLLA